MGGVLRDIGHVTGRDDPVVHFYETFLAAYDPALREKRGSITHLSRSSVISSARSMSY
jgi:hypothetical protein